jgi:hypothetical protein
MAEPVGLAPALVGLETADKVRLAVMNEVLERYGEVIASPETAGEWE